MPNILIEGQLYEWTPACAPGDPTADFENLLISIYVQRIAIRARYFAVKNPSADRQVIQAEIHRIAESFVFDDEPEPDAVEVEAIEIAEETIRMRLAESNLPPPKSLRDHAMMIATEPKIVEEAKRRVLARAQATRELLGSTSA